MRAVATGLAKLELFNHLRLPVPLDGAPYPPGYVHLPRVDAEFLKQLCAEQLVTRRDRRGYARREWQKLRERNEALDCYVYARATAAVLGLERMTDRHWRRRAAELGAAEPAPVIVETAPVETVSVSSEPRQPARDPWLRDERRSGTPSMRLPTGRWLGRR